MSRNLPGRAKVVVVLHPDGYCEVFTDGWTDAVVVCPKQWEDAGEVIPKVFQELVVPGNLVANGFPEYVKRPEHTTEEAFQQHKAYHEKQQTILAIKAFGEAVKTLANEKIGLQKEAEAKTAS